MPAAAAAAPQSQVVKSIIKPEDVSPSLKGIKYVIFPHQKCEFLLRNVSDVVVRLELCSLGMFAYTISLQIFVVVAQYWDFLMILIIIYYALYIPFHLGISGGYLSLTNNWMLGFNLFVNWIFFGKSYFIGYEVSCWFINSSLTPIFTL
jgi:hypothetical protein